MLEESDRAPNASEYDLKRSKFERLNSTDSIRPKGDHWSAIQKNINFNLAKTTGHSNNAKCVSSSKMAKQLLSIQCAIVCHSICAATWNGTHLLLIWAIVGRTITGSLFVNIKYEFRILYEYW